MNQEHTWEILLKKSNNLFQEVVDKQYNQELKIENGFYNPITINFKLLKS